MSVLKRSLILAFLTIATCCALGALSSHDYSEKTDTQLLRLLEDHDRSVRVDAALYLGYRYRKHGAIINPPTYKNQHPEFPLPPQIIPHLAAHLMSDPDYAVRIEAMRAIRELKTCTNTTQIVAAGLEDTNVYVRVWTCGALIDISNQYSEPLVAGVISTLRQSLSLDGEEEPTWIAAWISGRLGNAGIALLPELEKLDKHRSSKVRQYAGEARQFIQQRYKK